MICGYDSSLESQNLLMIKDLFKLKTYLNFSDLIFKTQNIYVFNCSNVIFKTQNRFVFSLNTNLIFFKPQN